MKTQLKKFKNWIIFTVLGVGVVLAAGALPDKKELPIHSYQVIEWQKPTTDKQWTEDVKKENFNVKHYYQLEEMGKNLTEKLPKVQKDLDKFNQCPECIKWGLREQFSEEFSGQKLENTIMDEYQSQLSYYKWKTDKISQSIERINKEKRLRDIKKVSRASEILGTTYYIDADNGTTTTAGQGTSSSTAWRCLDQFTENARSAGDKVIIRRGTTARIDNGSDLLFTSDGTISNPIVIEADYDNVWNDRVDLSGTGTATLTFGSKTITFSADISSALSAGDWIYASGDATRDFAYEVASVSTVTVTLYLPYKGAQAGSGKTIYNMKAAPVWNIATGNYQWNFDGDDHWKIQGIYIKGTDLNGQIEIDSADGHLFKDCILEGNGTSDYGVKTTDDSFTGKIIKTRFYNNLYGLVSANGSGSYRGVKIKNCFFDGNNVSSSCGIYAFGFDTFYVFDCELQNYAFADIKTTSAGSKIIGRNITFNSVTPIDNYLFHENYIFIEDYDNNIGDNKQFNRFSINKGTTIIQKEISIIRSGGGGTSMKITPSIKLGSNWELSKLQMFEYPIYADTTSKTYTIYFKTNATANWTADPTNSELWIEAEYWGHASNNHRKLTKSTGVIDFNGSTAWQSLSVTVQPSQTGILYLRGWYCKIKETPSNIFYVDVKPVIN